MTSLQFAGRALLLFTVLIGGLAFILMADNALAEPPEGFINETLVSDLITPRAMAFLPDGRMLVVDGSGQVLLSTPPYLTTETTPVLTISNLALDGGSQGILNLLIDPDFATNHYLYLFYTAQSPARHRISRFTFDPATNTAPADSEVIVWQDNVAAGRWHFGGAMAFGPDGFFYFTTGDNHDTTIGTRHVAQDATKSWGKLHRITLLHEGQGPPWHPYYTTPLDNPYWDGVGPNYDEIYAIGLRNPFRMSFDSAGTLYVTDVGGNIAATAWEEVNLGEKGANYGWPLCEGSHCRAGVSGTTTPIFAYSHEDGQMPGTFRDASITGGFVYEADQFPAVYQGVYFYADYPQHIIRYLTFDQQGQVDGDYDFEPADGTRDDPAIGDIVDLKVGPDGALYYVDIGVPWGDASSKRPGSVRRIRYNATGNSAPVITAQADRTSGNSPLTVNFSAQAEDAENDALTYDWRFGNGATSSAQNPTYTYQNNGLYTARLAVSDGTNWTFSEPLLIAVGIPPIVQITAPVTGSTFRAGDTIAYTGHASDPDGTLTEQNYTWRVVLNHDSHFHPFTGPECCTTTGSFLVESSGHSWEGDTWYEINLTVTDADGLQAQDQVVLYSEEVLLTFETIPSGLEIIFDELAARTPFQREALIGFHHEIKAPLEQRLDNQSYLFEGWAHGGAAQQTIVTPEQDASFVAIYKPLCPAQLVVSHLAPTSAQSSAAEITTVLYQVRDDVMADTVAGHHYRDLYEQYRGDISMLLARNPKLLHAAQQLLGQVLAGLEGIANNAGNDFTVTPGMVERFTAFVDLLGQTAQTEGYGELAQTITVEQARLDWRQLEERTFAQAWTYMNTTISLHQDTLYLPSLTR